MPRGGRGGGGRWPFDFGRRSGSVECGRFWSSTLSSSIGSVECGTILVVYSELVYFCRHFADLLHFAEDALQLGCVERLLHVVAHRELQHVLAHLGV